jgi:FMN-dependent NADH-azoreductase
MRIGFAKLAQAFASAQFYMWSERSNNMTTLMHIKASPRDSLSHSTKAAVTFIAALQARRNDIRVIELDVWRVDLPPFDGALIAAKYARLAGRRFTADEARAWEQIEALVHNLDVADLVLISSPMWNLSIPYRLKHYIDLVTQPGLSFTFDPGSGYSPLLRSRPAIAILASSGDFSEGPSWGRPDLATPYLRHALAFIGLAGLEVVAVGPTAGPPEHVAAAAARAGHVLDALAERFARAAA